MPTPPRPGLDELDALVDQLAAGLSPSRRWQYQMVVRELRAATERDDFPPGPDAPLEELLSVDNLAVYLDLAKRGELRAKLADRGTPTAPGTVLARIRTLGPLAAAAGHPIDPGPVPAYSPRPTVPSRQREVLRSYLLARAEDDDNPYRIRLLALVGVVLDTEASAASLAAMRLDHFNARGDAIHVARIPQGRSVAPTTWTRRRLRVSTQTAVKRWLVERAKVVESMHENPHLWVSLFPNHTGESGPASQATPPGIPLQPKGVQRAYRRSIAYVNEEMDGEPGWVPLPTTLEELRRGVVEDRQAKEARQHRGA
jgi:hypothetical protein